MANPWQLYDELIDLIPADLVVEDCLAGLHWFLVRSQGTGVTMCPHGAATSLRQAGQIRGLRLRELAAWIKSWNFYEAAMGLAAINSYINARTTVEQTCGAMLEEAPDADIFNSLREPLRGRRVCVVGHFPNLERLSAVAQLSILERLPQPGDLPDPACEYILGEQDVVILTGTTLINKTMPRLLELAQHAEIVVVGPSTPLHPLMFQHGITRLGGLIVDDDAPLWRCVAEGGEMGIFRHGGRMVQVARQAAMLAR